MRIPFRQRIRARGLSGQALIYVGAAALNAAIPFVLLPFLAHWLGPAGLGIVGTFMALVNILGLVVGLNTHGLISVVYFRDGEAALPGQVGAAIALSCAMAVLLGIVSFALSGLIMKATSMPEDWHWAILAAGLGQFLMSVGLTVAQSLRRPITYGSLQVGYGLALAVGTLLLVGVAQWDWRGRIVAQVLAAVAVGLLAACWLWRSSRLVTPGRPQLAAALRFGLPLLPHSAAAIIMASVDRVVLNAYAGPAAAGAYYLAFQLASIPLLIANAVNQAWLPWLYERLARNDGPSLGEIATRLKQIAGVLLVGSAAIALCAPVLVPLIGGSAYAPAVRPLQLLAPALACQSWYLFMSGFLFYQERTVLLSTIMVAAAAIQVGLTFFLVAWGVAGVALAIFAGSAIYAVAVSVAAVRITRGLLKPLQPTAASS